MAEQTDQQEDRGTRTADPLYRNILVPTDGSHGARRGAHHALDLASQYDATVHVIHVLDERRQADTPALSSEELVFEKLEDRGREFLDQVANGAQERGLEAVVECCRGVPCDEILAYAQANDIDLIVMGVHGDERGGRPHIGSTTERVILSSRVPVLPV